MAINRGQVVANCLSRCVKRRIHRGQAVLTVEVCETAIHRGQLTVEVCEMAYHTPWTGGANC